MSGINLRGCQIEAVKQMKNGCILCGGVGSGKSRTALAYYYICNGGDINNKERGMNNPKDLYIITTAKQRDSLDWQKEMGAYLITTNDDLKIYDHVVVVDSWNNIKKYRDVKDAFFIFDEDKVTGSGEWVKTFLHIVKSNEWIILSATPGDKYEDYIPVFIANGFYKNKTQFSNEHLLIRWNQHGKYPEVKGYINTRRMDRLIKSLLVDIKLERHTIQHHEDIWCKYDLLKYRDLMKNRWNYEKNQPFENISELCYSLRKLVNCDQSREIKVLELLEKHPRMIIFYNLDCELDILRNLAENNGISYAEWNGHKHQSVPEGEKWLYLVHYNAAEAWNCIKTDTIVFFSQTYSYKTLVQAAGRIDRMNTPYTDLWYFHLKSTSKIDLAIQKALRNKKKFNENAFLGGK